MEKKAEAYKKYNGAAMAEMMIRIMPEMAAEIAKPLSQIDKIAGEFYLSYSFSVQQIHWEDLINDTYS